MKLIIIFGIISLFISFALTQENPYKILVTLAANSQSHLRSMLPLINRLANSGHHVYILNIYSKEKPEKYSKNVSIIRVPINFDQENDEQVKFMENLMWHYTLHSPMLSIVYKMVGGVINDVITSHSEKFIQTINSKWDLVLVSELFNSQGYSIANLLYERDGVPYVIFSSSMIMGMHGWAKAVSHNWLNHPHPFSPNPGNGADGGFNPKLFNHRLIHSLEGIGDFISKPFTGSATLVDAIEYLGFPQPEVSEIYRIGAHCEESSKLPKEYLNFVEDPKSKGTIYVAFGTAIAWGRAPPHIIEAFFTVFSKLNDYRIIFAFKGSKEFLEKREKSPQHIRIVEWAPQLDILAHPKTKVFLTHGGLKSVKESICSKTPMLAMPIFAEQNHNTHMVLKYGIGIALNKVVKLIIVNSLKRRDGLEYPLEI
uniref:UDP-glucuronosyltransferase n=1 Tax=Meloidogyne hapla TaxID=6305 RepID=A0A1I8BDA2_MELHA